MLYVLIMLAHDRRKIARTAVTEHPTAVWLVERVIDSIRRECLDHIELFNERHLGRVLSLYVDYYQCTRTHLSLYKDCPVCRPVMPAGSERWSVS